jgi:hypothetical protein
MNNKLIINGKRIIIRNDYMISNWALAYYLIYISILFLLYLTNNKLDISFASPKLFIIIALIIATLTLLYGTYLNVVSKNNVISYIIMTLLLKILPLYTVRNDKINKNVIIFTLMIIILYLCYLDINEKSFFNIYLAISYNHPTELGIIFKKIFKDINESYMLLR